MAETFDPNGGFQNVFARLLDANDARISPGDASAANQAALNNAIGTAADAPWTGSGSGTVVAAVKSLLAPLLAATPAGANAIGTVGVTSLPALPAGANTIGTVNIAGTVPVSGTFWQATQPVSGTITANAGSGTFAVSGTFWQATQPVSGTVTANAGSGTMATSVADGANVTIGALADAAYAGSGNASLVAGLKGLYAAMIAATPAGSNLMGKVGLDQTSNGNTNAVTVKAPPAAPSSNLSNFRVVTGTAGVIKSSAGTLFKLSVYNANAALRYLHIYNKSSSPTLTVDSPYYTLALPPASAREVDFTQFGMYFTPGQNGIAWAYTTDDVATPATAGTSGELHFSGLYV